MTTVTFPTTPKPQTMSWRLVQPAQNNISQWTGARQVMSLGRGWWECQIVYPPIVGTSNFNPWRSFIGKMRGSVNDVRVATDTVAQTAITNVMQVNGAGQTGRALNVDGLPESSVVLVAGQFVTLNSQLLQLTDDVVTNASGQATLNFSPPMRVIPDDNTVVEFKNPFCLMYLVEDPMYSVEPGRVYSLSLNLREAF